MAQAQTIPLTRHAYADGSFKKMLIDGMTLDQMLRREPEGNWSYAYLTILICITCGWTTIMAPTSAFCSGRRSSWIG
jgi:hypothetical protein